ncbi:MAG: hypothetical protein ACREUT_04250 [Steroidobacteraceae bacterium]
MRSASAAATRTGSGVECGGDAREDRAHFVEGAVRVSGAQPGAERAMQLDEGLQSISAAQLRNAPQGDAPAYVPRRVGLDYR